MTNVKVRVDVERRIRDKVARRLAPLVLSPTTVAALGRCGEVGTSAEMIAEFNSDD